MMPGNEDDGESGNDEPTASSLDSYYPLDTLGSAVDRDSGFGVGDFNDVAQVTLLKHTLFPREGRERESS